MFKCNLKDVMGYFDGLTHVVDTSQCRFDVFCLGEAIRVLQDG